MSMALVIPIISPPMLMNEKFLLRNKLRAAILK
jgi:hypothetical protein